MDDGTWTQSDGWNMVLINTMECHDMGLDLLDGKKTETLRHYFLNYKMYFPFV